MGGAYEFRSRLHSTRIESSFAKSASSFRGTNRHSPSGLLAEPVDKRGENVIRMTLADAEVRRLRRERQDHPHPRVRRKMETLLLRRLARARAEVRPNRGVVGARPGAG